MLVQTLYSQFQGRSILVASLNCGVQALLIEHDTMCNLLKCSWNFTILDWTECWPSNGRWACWSRCLCLSFSSLASLCSGVSEAIISIWRVLILSSLASLCCWVSAANLSLSLVCFLWSLASFCSSLSASLLALSLSLRFLNRCSLSAAVSEAQRALSLSLLRWSLLSLDSSLRGRLRKQV